VITRHGKPAGVLIGFGTEDDWFEYRLVNDPRGFSAASRRPDRAFATDEAFALEDVVVRAADVTPRANDRLRSE
jgi:hypothetical protein